MSRAELIYPLERRLEKILERIASDPFNAEIMMRYYKVRSTEIKIATVVRDFLRLCEMSRLLGKRFEDATVQDIEDLIFRIDKKKNADNTKNTFRKILKAFYRWLRGCSKGEYPPEVKWITFKKVPIVTVTAADLIPYDTCIRISECAVNIRDKALFQCKLDAGCRIGEVLTPRIGEVEFNENGAVLFSDGKTGYKPIILTWAAKTLAMWLNVHPFRHDRNAPLFCLVDRQKPTQMSYAAAYQAFRKCVKKSGVSKRVWPHLFKHVSSTEDANRGLPDSYRKYKHHWSPHSRMNSVYEHLSSSVISNIQSETWRKYGGLEAKQEQQEQIQLLRRCMRCQSDNSRDSIFCNRCGFALDSAKSTEIAILQERLKAAIGKLSGSPEKIERVLTLLAQENEPRIETKTDSR